jgi:Family of unknown function (DUF5691)
VTLSYDDLVTAATVGITRKPLAVTGLGGPAAGYDGVLDAGDPAAALLDAAALLTVARRAGVQPRRGVTVPAFPADPAPALPKRAVESLLMLRWPRSYRSAGDDGDLMADLLNAAADAGYVASGPLLAELLDAMLRSPTLGPAVTRVLGIRGRRLARYRPEWLDSVAAADALQDPETWRTGTPAARLGYLSGLRDRDPDAARDLLAAAWGQEHGRDRARFISVLSRRLSPADEEFLEAAITDRSATVRTQALRLLARLPASAFCRRMSGRSAGLVRLEGTGPGRRLVITVPGKPDAAAVRDGIGGSPPVTTIGEVAWRLIQMLAATPLPDWTGRFGLTPREIAALPVEGNLRGDVHAGWRLAAVSQDEGEWAQALLDAGDTEDGRGRPAEAWPPDQLVAAALPQDARAARAVVLLTVASMSSPDGRGDDMPAEVAAYPPPWPSALADAAIAALDREVASVLEKPSYIRSSMRRLAWHLLEAAGHCMPTAGNRDYAAELMRLASASPAGSYQFRSAAQTIALRRAFYEEIS